MIDNLLNQPLVVEFVGAFLGAAFSFGALVWWQKWRERRDDQRAISAAKNELQVNLIHNQANLDVLRSDIEAQKENQTSLPNLTFLQGEEMRYALARIHKRPPTDKLSFHLRQVIHLVEMVNQKLQYRETYRIHKEGMGNYSTRMTKLDTIVIEACENLKQEADKVIAMLAAEADKEKTL